MAAARAAFEERGYTAHTPSLRYHELPSHEGAMKVASLGLRDYTDDLVAFANSLDSPALLLGHSMGGCHNSEGTASATQLLHRTATAMLQTNSCSIRNRS